MDEIERYWERATDLYPKHGEPPYALDKARRAVTDIYSEPRRDPPTYAWERAEQKAGPSVGRREEFRSLSCDEQDALPPPDFLIDYLVQRGGVGDLFGPWGTYKTPI